MQVKGFWVLCLTIVFAGGCSTYRLLPSHGGGKRFDEEQRTVSASIRNAVAQIDVNSLSGHKVNLMIVALGHNGGASITMPGFNSISAGVNYSDLSYMAPYVQDKSTGGNANISYNPSLAAWPTVFASDQDLTYFESVLQMKLRLNNSMISPADAEYTLYILVDVLGTNRSKVDSLIFTQDRLIATCEVTYYITDSKTGKVVGKVKRAGSQSAYQEQGWIGFSAADVTRSSCAIEPPCMPTEVNDAVVTTKTVIVADGLEVKKNQNVSKVSKADLTDKLKQADNFIQAGNLTASEMLITEVRSADPAFPGLAEVSSRLNAARDIARQASEAKKAEAPKAEVQKGPEPAKK